MSVCFMSSLYNDTFLNVCTLLHPKYVEDFHAFHVLQSKLPSVFKISIYSLSLAKSMQESSGSLVAGLLLLLFGAAHQLQVRDYYVV